MSPEPAMRVIQRSGFPSASRRTNVLSGSALVRGINIQKKNVDTLLKEWQLSCLFCMFVLGVGGGKEVGGIIQRKRRVSIQNILFKYSLKRDGQLGCLLYRHVKCVCVCGGGGGGWGGKDEAYTEKVLLILR